MLLTLAALAMLAQPSAPPRTPAWKFVAIDGPLFIFYVPAERAEDKQVYAEIVRYVFQSIGDQGPFQADFFDDEAKTPKSHQYNDDNRACQRARFNYNPVNGTRRFLWIRPADPANPKGKRVATEDTLPLDDPKGSSGATGKPDEKKGK